MYINVVLASTDLIPLSSDPYINPLSCNPWDPVCKGLHQQGERPMLLCSVCTCVCVLGGISSCVILICACYVIVFFLCWKSRKPVTLGVLMWLSL